jgi:hypothetical protein
MIKKNYQDLLDCYLSGQMSEKQWEGHKQDDPDFQNWLSNVKGPRPIAEPNWEALGFGSKEEAMGRN